MIREDRPDGSVILRSRAPIPTAVDRTTDWLDRWAAETPQAVFLGERSGAGWREVTYGEAREIVLALAAGFLDLGLGPDRPLMVISGNGVDHGLLALAAQYVGVPVIPVAEQYALIPDAAPRLDELALRARPGAVFAEDGATFGGALRRSVFGDAIRLVSQNGTDGQMVIDHLARVIGDAGPAHATVGPDTVAKILFTSGSTSAPKGVLTTHRMMCANQAQIAAAMPFLAKMPPRLVDWLPWNHVFGGSHNFNLALANGGSLHVDQGKPVPHLIGTSIENLRQRSGTIAFNVPAGFALLRDALRDDPALRRCYFKDLKMLFYAGASLPQDVWADLEAMAADVGAAPLFTSSWGLTETAPAVLLQHQLGDGSGRIGVPLPGSDVKLIPTDEPGRWDVRVRGPQVFEAYLEAPEATAAAFDEEGFFISQDAMRMVDESDMNQGLRFDGRLSEDFKLQTGIWVRAANLRLDALRALSGLASDVIVCGEGQATVGLLMVPTERARSMGDQKEGLIEGAELHNAIAAALAGQTGGSADRIDRVAVLDAPPSMAEGEMTAKGNINSKRLLCRRSGLVDRLYSDDPSVIRL